MENIAISDGKKEVNFKVTRLNPQKQTYLLIKMIGMVAKGSITNSFLVEQALHNAIYSGIKIPGAEKEKSSDSLGKIILEAVKGAIANLSDDDRDYIFSELLKTVSIVAIESKKSGVNSLESAVTWNDLNFHFENCMGPMKLFRALMELNFGFFLDEIKSNSLT